MPKLSHEEMSYKSRVAKYKFISGIVFMVLVFLAFLFRYTIWFISSKSKNIITNIKNKIK